ncbi:CHAT domain-containing protein [Streptomyces sp. NPDC048521]|uniref:CHAT domain-containing tetratricopeptide repeat protein n=1 Tax=Streptomyces sp. NPDC048521 TaxID=3365566 RepID=UPI003710A260
MRQSHDELIRALEARVALFAATMDADAVLAPQALAQARALMDCVPDPARDPQAVRTLAGLYRARSIALPGDEGDEAAAIAAALEEFAGPGDDGALGPVVAGSSPASLVEALDRWQELDRMAVELTTAAENSSHAPESAELLARAVEAARVAVDAVPRELPPFRAEALTRLGRALQARYRRDGRLHDLHEAIRALREAEVAHGSGHPNRATLVTLLGVALRERYERDGALEDLEEAVRYAREAVACVPDGDPGRPGRLHNLGIALRLRHERLGDAADLTEARGLALEARAAAPPGHPAFGMVRLGLGNTATDQDRIAAYEEALSALPPADPARPRLLQSLVGALMEAMPAGDGPSSVMRLEQLLDEAADALPDDHADQAALLYTRGRLRTAAVLHIGRVLSQVPARLLEGAAQCHQAAALHPAALPSVRFRALVHWAHLAVVAGRWREAARVYGHAVEMLPSLSHRHLSFTDTEHALTISSGLACDAAAACLAVDDPERALALLELGRGILLGRGLQGRDDMSELYRQDPRTARRLAELRTALDDPDARPGPHGIGLAGRPDDDATASDLRHRYAAEWDRLVDHVRTTRPGMRHFMRPPPVSELLAQAAAGPVVVVSVSRIRCDALLLTTTGLRVLPLPRLTHADAETHARRFLSTLRTFTDPRRDVLDDPARQDALDATLCWLWDTVARPVLDALGLDGRPDGDLPPRLWWVPTGPLTVLPLHAAGHHRTSGAGAPPTVMDRAVSSYAPTVRALAHTRHRAGAARTRSRRPDGPARCLVVSVPDAPGTTALDRAAEETSVPRAAGAVVEVLEGASATRVRVMGELPHHRWLHFCGHGVTDPDSPSHSHLVLHGPEPRLTVADISRLDLPDAELAYLSACGTAGTGTALADEALHVASALQLAGYRHVVGTLWEVDDEVALRVAGEVYRALGSGPTAAHEVAHALHRAVRAVRDRYRTSPWFWAAHIHVGV